MEGFFACGKEVGGSVQVPIYICAMMKLICELACVPMRREPADRSEMTNQVVFGETMELLDQNDKWYFVQLDHDGYQGWVDRKQVQPLESLLKGEPTVAPMFFAARNKAGILQFLPAGSLLWEVNGLSFRCGTHEMELMEPSANAPQSLNLVRSAWMSLRAPYLWGGRTLFGMDCSGFTQLTFRLAGKWIQRDSSQQAEEGEIINFIEESKNGDLAFFDNPEGKITHVGIVFSDEKTGSKSIIHCSGEVRIDKIDSYGIFNEAAGTYSHNLRLIRRIGVAPFSK